MFHMIAQKTQLCGIYLEIFSGVYVHQCRIHVPPSSETNTQTGRGLLLEALIFTRRTEKWSFTMLAVDQPHRLLFMRETESSMVTTPNISTSSSGTIKELKFDRWGHIFLPILSKVCTERLGMWIPCIKKLNRPFQERTARRKDDLY